MSAHKVALRLTNSTDNTMTLSLEPWGEQHDFGSGATLEIEAQGPDGDTLEIEYGESNITVYGWSGSTVRVTEMGCKDAKSELIESVAHSIKAPSTPTKLSSL